MSVTETASRALKTLKIELPCDPRSRGWARIRREYSRCPKGVSAPRVRRSVNHSRYGDSAGCASAEERVREA